MEWMWVWGFCVRERVFCMCVWVRCECVQWLRVRAWVDCVCAFVRGRRGAEWWGTLLFRARRAMLVSSFRERSKFVLAPAILSSVRVTGRGEGGDREVKELLS